jgi:hypothetical protein
MMKTKIFYLILCMLVCVGFRSMAQSGHIQKEMENGTVSFARFSTDTASQPLSKSICLPFLKYAPYTARDGIRHSPRI